MNFIQLIVVFFLVALGASISLGCIFPSRSHKYTENGNLTFTQEYIYPH
jgi:hypothetical protein